MTSTTRRDFLGAVASAAGLLALSPAAARAAEALARNGTRFDGRPFAAEDRKSHV